MNEMKDNYESFYRRISAPFRARPALAAALRILNRCLTLLMYAAYPVILLLLLHSRLLLRAILVPGISFALLSFVRDRINRPRPYEKWNIDPLIHKNTTGHSMPSRHIFSSAVISMVYLRIFPGIGILFLVLSALSAVIRVIGGVHYISDVAAGYAAGVAAGLLMFI